MICLSAYNLIYPFQSIFPFPYQTKICFPSYLWMHCIMHAYMQLILSLSMLLGNRMRSRKSLCFQILQSGHNAKGSTSIPHHVNIKRFRIFIQFSFNSVQSQLRIRKHCCLWVPPKWPKWSFIGSNYLI